MILQGGVEKSFDIAAWLVDDRISSWSLGTRTSLIPRLEHKEMEVYLSHQDHKQDDWPTKLNHQQRQYDMRRGKRRFVFVGSREDQWDASAMTCRRGDFQS